MKHKRIITGIKPTGSFHIGNYFGALRQAITLQKEGELFLFLADLHALTGLSDDRHDSGKTNKEVYDILSAYLAFDLNPQKVIVYRQSDFPQITELFWIFSCLLKHNFLTIGHAYKDALQDNGQPGLGTFLYPALMASDILISGAEIVPVGKDQVQHIEITREIARKFNLVTNTNYFTEPQERVLEEVATVPGIDGRKMSKSYGNELPIFASEVEIRKRIMAITTDSTPAGQAINPKNCILCNYLELLLPQNQYAEIENKCLAGTITYKELKDLLFQAYLTYFADARQKYEMLSAKQQYLDRVLSKNYKKIDALFTKRLNEVRELLGLHTPKSRLGRMLH